MSLTHTKARAYMYADMCVWFGCLLFCISGDTNSIQFVLFLFWGLGFCLAPFNWELQTGELFDFDFVLPFSVLLLGADTGAHQKA